MNRRRLLQMAPAVAGAMWVGETAAQGTPAASPMASPEAMMLPQRYSDVAQEYDELTSRLLEEGRAAVDALVQGDIDQLHANFSPEMQAVISADQMGALLATYTVDQVHFEVPTYPLVFDAQVSGDTMSGFLQSGGLTPFTVQREVGTPVASPTAGTPALEAVLAGTWTSAAQLPDGSDLAIELTFSGDGQQGTMSIPDQNVIRIPLANIAFHSEQPLGERTTDRAVPLSPRQRIYWARYDWGGRGMTITVGFDDAGTIVSMQVLPEFQLPPDPAAGMPPLPPLQLPFQGLWWVLWGGATVAENYHMPSTQQRYAVDIMIWNDGATYHDDPGQNENYWVWGQPVLAPVDGTVVAVVDGIDANTPGALPADPSALAGNHVVLQIGEAAYLFLAHMQAGSLLVAEGDSITVGTPVGLVGNSGNSSEPHLHIHAQSDRHILSHTAVGLPIVFEHLLVDGEPVADVRLEQGTFVAPA